MIPNGCRPPNFSSNSLETAKPTTTTITNCYHPLASSQDFRLAPNWWVPSETRRETTEDLGSEADFLNEHRHVGSREKFLWNIIDSALLLIAVEFYQQWNDNVDMRCSPKQYYRFWSVKVGFVRITRIVVSIFLSVPAPNLRLWVGMHRSLQRQAAKASTSLTIVELFFVQHQLIPFFFRFSFFFTSTSALSDLSFGQSFCGFFQSEWSPR